MAAENRSGIVSEFLSTHYRRIRVGVVVFGIVMRLGVHFDLQAHDPLFRIPSLDSRAFLDWAQNIAAGDLLGSHVFFLNPLYPYLLSPLVAAFGPTPLLEIRVLQMALGVATILLVASAVRRTLGEAHALGAALVVAAYPLLLFYEQVVMIVTVAVFLNALALHLLAKLPEKPTLGRTLLAGLPLGLAILARPNVGLFAALLPIWLLRIGPPGRRIRFALSRTAVLAVGAFLMVLPCTIRNYVVGRDVVLVTSSGGVNLWVSNNPKAREERRMTSAELRANPKLIETDAIVYAERETGRDLKPSEVSSFWSKKALGLAWSEPLPTLRFLGLKLLMFTRGFEIPSSYHYVAQREEAPFLGSIPLTWALLSPFALLGLVVVLVRKRDGLLLALLYVAYAVGLAVFFPLAHYRAPVLPAAIPLAVVGGATLGGALLDFRFGTAARWSPVFLVCLMLAFPRPTSRLFERDLFPGYPDDRVVFWFNRGMVLLNQRKLEDADAAFRRGAKADDTSWLPHMGFAAVARARGEFANERRHLEDALRLRPNDPGALARMAQNFYVTGDPRDALALARNTVERFPMDGIALTTLADLTSREGNYEEALQLYRRAEDTGLEREFILAEQSRMLRMMGRLDEAAATVERGLRILPESGPLHYERAFLLVDRGAPASAVQEEIYAGLRSGYAVPPGLKHFLTEGNR